MTDEPLPSPTPAITGPVICVVMGVSGSGKTTIAEKLAQALGAAFKDGDALHPAANVAKMRAGIPLDDADRWPWLEAVAALIDGWRAAGRSGTVSCSALKRAYREVVIGQRTDVTLVYLKGSFDLIHDRMAARTDHFMPASLLESQFADLEAPGPDEHPITVGIDAAPDAIVAEVVRELAARG